MERPKRRLRNAGGIVVEMAELVVHRQPDSGAIRSLDNHSLIALGVVIIAAAAGGIAFSWKRYYRRVPRTDR